MECNPFALKSHRLLQVLFINGRVQAFYICYSVVYFTGCFWKEYGYNILYAKVCMKTRGSEFN
jgi:hypothetical protein